MLGPPNCTSAESQIHSHVAKEESETPTDLCFGGYGKVATQQPTCFMWEGKSKAFFGSGCKDSMAVAQCSKLFVVVSSLTIHSGRNKCSSVMN